MSCSCCSIQSSQVVDNRYLGEEGKDEEAKTTQVARTVLEDDIHMTAPVRVRVNTGSGRYMVGTQDMLTGKCKIHIEGSVPKNKVPTPKTSNMKFFDW
jgi:hypothetical protein